MEWLSDAVDAVVPDFTPDLAGIPMFADSPAADLAGTGGGSPAAIASAFPHYVEGVEEPELAPEIPAERPDLPQEQMDAKLEEMSEKMREPDAGHASEVVTDMVAMSDAQRREAMSNLSDDEVDALLENLPPDQQEKLNELVAACDDPKRKLVVWKAAELAELGREDRNLDKVPHSTEHLEDPETRLLLRRMAAVDDAQDEVTSEVEHATDELEATDDPAEQMKIVNDLIARKEKERDLEREYGVNITNDDGGADRERGHATPRAVWSKDELEQMEVVLERLPDEAVQGNPELREIRAVQQGHDYDEETDTWIPDETENGEHRDGVIRIADRVMTADGKHAGDSSRIGGFDNITRFQQTLAHEVGHNVAKSSPEGKEKAKQVMDAAGWSAESGDRANEYADLDGPAPDGRVYVRDGDEIYSYDPALLPSGGEHTDKNNKADTWNYAKANPDEYIAELYGKAIVAPELLYADLVEGPAKRFEEVSRDPSATSDEVLEALAAKTAMENQYKALRGEVFGLDEQAAKDSDAVILARADDMGLEGEAREQYLKDYRADAARAMTPEQLAVVQASYEDAAWDY